MSFLTIVGVVLGIIGLVSCGFLGLLVWVALDGEEHTKKQVCPECGKKAEYIGGRVEEAGGQLSYTDAIYAQYRCPNGHVSYKKWTVRNPLG